LKTKKRKKGFKRRKRLWASGEVKKSAAKNKLQGGDERSRLHRDERIRWEPALAGRSTGDKGEPS